MKQVSAAILLGASEFPKSAFLNEGGQSFMLSMAKIRRELLPLLGCDSAILNLFNYGLSASDHYEKIEEFLGSHNNVKNLFVFYIGHGGVSELEQRYFLTIKDTRPRNQYQSSLHPDILARIFREKIGGANRFLFLDACFSAAAVYAFQGVEQQVVSEKLKEIKWNDPASKRRGGTAIVCAASKHNAARYLENGTMFSLALVEAALGGDDGGGEFLSLEEIFEKVRLDIATNNPRNAVIPELHIPDQRSEAIHKEPIIPNNAFRGVDSVKRTSGGETGHELEKKRIGSKQIIFASIIAVLVAAASALYIKYLPRPAPDEVMLESMDVEERGTLTELVKSGCFFMVNDSAKIVRFPREIGMHQKDFINRLTQNDSIEIAGYVDSSEGRWSLDGQAGSSEPQFVFLSKEYAMTLSERRANAVRDYLALQNFPLGKFETIAYGSERPSPRVGPFYCSVKVSVRK